jgi:hypothetical protein
VIVSRSMRVIWAFVVAGVAVALLAGVVLAQALFVGTVTRDANLRAGPGTTFAVVGSARAGSSVVVSGTNPAGDWYQLDDGKWIAAFLVRSGDAAPPVATARPTARPRATSTPRPLAIVTPAAFASGGLGQDRAWWERLYGRGEPAVIGQKFNRFEVMFDGGRARHIERLHFVPMPFIGAQREIRSLLPADAEFIELTMPADRPGTWIELYRSPSLADRFVGAVWPNAEPGEFVVIYKLEDDQKASRVIVATGNDP